MLLRKDIIRAAVEHKLGGGRFHHEESLNGTHGISWDRNGTHYYIYSILGGGVFVQINWSATQQLIGTDHLYLHNSRALMYWITKNQVSDNQ